MSVEFGFHGPWEQRADLTGTPVKPFGPIGRMRHTTMHLLHYYRRCHNGKESRRIH